MKHLFILVLAIFSTLLVGCGVVIRKHSDPDAIQQVEEDDNENQQSVTEVSVVLPGPPILHSSYPYSNDQFPHRRIRNYQPGACFVTVCY